MSGIVGDGGRRFRSLLSPTQPQNAAGQAAEDLHGLDQQAEADGVGCGYANKIIEVGIG